MTRLIPLFQDGAPLATGAAVELKEGSVLALGRGPKLTVPACADGVARLELVDPRVSGKHARLVRKGGGVVLTDVGSKNGTFVNDVPITQEVLSDNDVIEIGGSFLLFRSEATAPPDEAQLGELARETLSHSLRADYAAIDRLSTADIPLLLMGEPGTGKELAARRAHGASGRAGDFVAVNCGALSPELATAELFGAARGAYTGAAGERVGFVERANRGTLFLDEVAELPLATQSALLRALQEREVVRVGECDPRPVDVLLVAATNRDLDRLAELGVFRADLLGRLRGFEVVLPPLRDRREDLGLIVAELLDRASRVRGQRYRLDTEALRHLFASSWPGNVRELEHYLRVAVARCDGAFIETRHLPTRPRGPEDTQRDTRGRLVRLLRKHHGNLAQVARSMGTSRSQVRRLVERYELPLDQFRTAGAYRSGDSSRAKDCAKRVP